MLYSLMERKHYTIDRIPNVDKHIMLILDLVQFSLPGLLGKMESHFFLLLFSVRKENLHSLQTALRGHALKRA